MDTKILAGMLLVVACGRLRFDAVVDGAADAVAPFTIRVTVVGEGVVTSDLPGITCGGTCTGTFTAPVILSATPADALTIDWSDGSCAGFACAFDTDAAITVTFGGPTTAANRVFVTSTAYTGLLEAGGDPNGLVAADRICQMTATAANLTGTFVAFLSSSTIGRNAVDALAGSSGWVDLDGKMVFATVADILANRQLMWLDHDEHDNVSGLGPALWRGGANGQAEPGADCGAFGTAGAASDAEVGLTTSRRIRFHRDLQPRVADPVLRDRQDIPLPSFPLGRVVFVSTAFISADAGVASADVECQSEARAAGLAGTFRAMLATSTTSIADHLGGLAGPWVRPDGYVVAFGTLPDLPVRPISSVGLTPWLGATSLGAIALTTEDCLDWTTTQNTSLGVDGFVPMQGETFDGGASSCNGAEPVYCAQL